MTAKERLRTLLVLAAAAGWSACQPATAKDANDWSTLQRGYYLTRAGDCEACHTVDPDKPMAGNYPLPTPFGTIYTANLTPDMETGIGAWTQDDFWRAMHEGRSRDGKRLYPAFPYTHFTITTREDSDAIFAYLQRLDPVRERTRQAEIVWPLNWRFLLAGWNLIAFEPRRFSPDPSRSEEWNRGRYLVEGLAHCGMCHSPKNALGMEADGDEAFTGGMVEGWWAPSLRSNGGGEGIGDWTKRDIVDFLRHGRNERTAAFGPMSDVVEHSTRHLTGYDIGAIAEYIKALPQTEGEDEERQKPLDPEAPAMQRGRLIYETQCSACHAPDGKGIEGMFAALAGSSLVHSSNPRTVVRAILEGIKATPTDRYPTPHAMPPFAWKLSDWDVAAVATYVRNAFGNAAPAVDAETVADIRESDAQPQSISRHTQ